jgi:hypothetical protein
MYIGRLKREQWRELFGSGDCFPIWFVAARQKKHFAFTRADLALAPNSRKAAV